MNPTATTACSTLGHDLGQHESSMYMGLKAATTQGDDMSCLSLKCKTVLFGIHLPLKHTDAVDLRFFSNPTGFNLETDTE